MCFLPPPQTSPAGVFSQNAKTELRMSAFSDLPHQKENNDQKNPKTKPKNNEVITYTEVPVIESFLVTY